MSTTHPLISVVTCFLNEERFLGEAVESVLHQDYPHWEMILVDDGSTDGSSGLAQAYSRQYPGRIFYVTHPGRTNRGLSASRNLGIRHARGSWIALLDADDVWHRDKLSAQAALLSGHPQAGMLCEASRYWHSWQESVKSDITIEVGDGLNGLFQPPGLLYLLYPFGAGAAPCPSGILIRKSAWEDLGGFEESFTGIYQLYEDQAFLCRMYLHQPVYISTDCHNLYRQRAGSLVHDIKAEGKYHAVRSFFLHWFEAYLRRKRIEDTVLWGKMKKALRPYRSPRYLPWRCYRRLRTFLKLKKAQYFSHA